MTRKSATNATLAALLTVGALALSGCTHASESSNPNSSGASGASAPIPPALDLSSIQTDPAAAALVPKRIRTRGTLVACTTPTYAPAAFLAGTDGRTPVGYDIDFGQAIAKTLGLKYEVQSMAFPSILPSLGTKCDLGTASLSITNARLKTVNFVSYLNAGTSWAVRKGNPTNFSLDNICGKSVGVQTGTIQESPDLQDRNAKCKADGKPGIKISSLPTQTAVTTRLTTGAIDAMAADSPVIGWAVAQTGGTLQKLGNPYSTLLMGIAQAKTDTDFTKATHDAVEKMIQDGIYRKILDRWGIADMAITKSEMNPKARV